MTATTAYTKKLTVPRGDTHCKGGWRRAFEAADLLSNVILAPAATKDAVEVAVWGIRAIRAARSAEEAAGAAKAAELALNRIYGKRFEELIGARFKDARLGVEFKTKIGKRVVDVLTSRGTAIESKTGRVSLDADIRQQIAKDELLLKSRRVPVRQVVWVFSRGRKGGRYGPTKPLLHELKRAGIRVVIAP